MSALPSARVRGSRGFSGGAGQLHRSSLDRRQRRRHQLMSNPVVYVRQRPARLDGDTHLFFLVSTGQKPKPEKDEAPQRLKKGRNKEC